MRKLERFWAALDRLRDWTLSFPHWQQELGADFKVVQHWLRPTQGRAGTYPCLGVEGDGCPMELVYHEDGPIVAVCGADPRRCERKVLKAEDTVLFELDLKRLGAEIGRALGFTVSFEEIPEGRCWSLGMRIDPAGSTVQVYLASAADEEDFALAVAALVSDGGKGFTLLTPTGSDLPVSSVQRLNRSECQLLALNALLYLSEDGRLEKVPDYLDADQRKNRATDDAGPEAVFRREGKVWRVAFGGQSGFVSHLVGMIYLSEILRRPYKSISSAELVKARTGEELFPVSGGQVVDQKALKACRNEAKRLSAAIATAKAKGKLTQERSLRRELSEILDYIRKGKGLRGRPRRVGDDEEKTRKAVLEGIKRSREALRTEVPKFAQHLDQTLHGGLSWSYQPHQKVDWQF